MRNTVEGVEQSQINMHTPGPWKCHGGWAVCVMSSSGRICECVNDSFTADTCDANAKLISAAPELLEACQLVAKWMLGGMPKPYSDTLVLELVGKAISKATGS